MYMVAQRLLHRHLGINRVLVAIQVFDDKADYLLAFQVSYI